MLVEERRTKLADLVRERGFAPLPDLAAALQVSESTVRRDLEFLEEQGAAKRTHGGAFYTGPEPRIPHFEPRQPAQWDKKKAIAKRVAELIQDGETLILDGGSTTYEVARLLVGRPLQIVTNSLPVANLFASDREAEVVMIGGVLDPRTGVAQGAHAERMLATVNANRTILSVSGIHDKGFYNNSLMLVQTEQAMMRSADEVVVVADSTKFGHTSLVQLCSLGEVKRLVCDAGLSAAWRQKLSRAGVELLVQEVEPVAS